MGIPRDPAKDRKRFFAALAVYLSWVAVLGALAVFSGHRPERAASAIESR